MKSLLLLRLLVVAALTLTSSGLFAAAAKSSPDKKGATPVAAKKKPEVRVDATPVTEGRSSVVTSYADVVEPVQKAVVSIYSTKIIKERVQVNPFLRQLFPGLQDQERESRQEGHGVGRDRYHRRLHFDE